MAKGLIFMNINPRKGGGGRGWMRSMQAVDLNNIVKATSNFECVTFTKTKQTIHV